MAMLFWGRGLRNPVTKKTMQGVQLYCTSVVSGRERVNGVDLFYQQTGKGDHAVLLLPGALGSAQTDFGPQLKSLSKDRFTVIGWDPRGYGNSRPPERDFPLDFFERDAKDAVDLMQALRFPRFSLLGWSDGGITALIAAARNPSLVNKMVVWGSNAYVSPQDLKIYNAIRDVSQWSERMRRPMEEVYGAELFIKTWEGWVDGIGQFAQRPEGKGSNIFAADSNFPVPLVSACGREYLYRSLDLCSVCPVLFRKHLYGAAASDQLSLSHHPRREGSHGAQLPPSVSPQTHQGFKVASDAGRETQPAPEVCCQVQQAG
uniref:Biphenyl hydrolase like n=1 Tax=Hucho hucho TaxID=62062 RepID=A0A4W5QF83_9TELE